MAIIGDLQEEASQELIAVTASSYLPRTILAVSPLPIDADAPELLSDKTMIDGLPTAYLCKQFVCKHPTTSPSTLARQLSLLGTD